MLNRRLEQIAEGEAIEGAALIVLDGLHAVLQGQGATERVELLSRIAGDGRDGHILLVAATTDPHAAKDLRWGARLVGRVPTPAQGAIAAGVPGSGAEGLLGAGDFLRRWAARRCASRPPA